MADVAVVVGNYEGAAVLPDCLASLAEQTLRPAEAVVVDAGSADASVAVATAAGARVVTAPNRGLGFLYNRGVEATGSEYVLLLNNDVALEPRCIELLAAALDADERRFAADPTQLDWAGERVIHARTTLTRGRMLREYLPGLHLDHVVPAGEITPTVCANGAAMLVRRSAFAELGGFDETFFMEWEDLDLCWRAWARDWPTRLRAGARRAPPRRRSHGRGRAAAARRLVPSQPDALRPEVPAPDRRDAHPFRRDAPRSRPPPARPIRIRAGGA